MDRDIDFVLVTGAGASCAFGAGGKRLPMMEEWSDHLVKALLNKGGHYLNLAGLGAGLSGPEFEEQLGRYLAARRSFPHAEQFIRATKDVQLGQYPSPAGYLESWYANVEAWLTEVDNTVSESLVQLFGRPELDVRAAARSYSDLLREVGVTPGGATSWVYATTNYDPVAELALQELGYPVNWGEQAWAGAGYGPLRIENLVKGIGAYVPLLHLHGRAGWYRDSNGTAFATDATAFNKGFGTPIVMLPDLAKRYDEGDQVVNSLWTQFESVLERARAVLVMGHSLHDTLLVRALRDRVTPPWRLGVAIYGHPDRDGEPANPNDETPSIIDEQLGTAVQRIYMRFGDSKNSGIGGLRNWFSTVRERESVQTS